MMFKTAYAIIFSSLFLVFAVSTPTSACGPSTDCQLGDQTFRIKMPDGYDKQTKVGAIIFAHGYRGTAAGLMRNKRLTKTISDMGLAFIAPKSHRQDWDIPNAPFKGRGREVEFFDALLEEITRNHHIDASRIIVSGFSAGGMMVWNLACERGDRFAGFVPISGTFWAPVPPACGTMPANIIHIHGLADKVVPLKGRPIQDTHQGDVYEALELATVSGDFSIWQSEEVRNGLACQKRQNKSGNILHLCLHPGGHTFKSVWLKNAWETLEAAGAFNR